jgi:adenine-specific DNA glycosylase
LICIENDHIWIKKRTKDDIWRHLYDFPEADEKILKKLRKFQLFDTSEHQLSHRKLTIFFWRVENLPENLKTSSQKVPISQFSRFATPKPINNFAIKNQLIAKPVDKKCPNVKKF